MPSTPLKCGSLQSSAHLITGFGCPVSGCGFRVSGFGFRVSGFGFRVSGVQFRVSGVGFRVSGFGFRFLGFEFRISDFGFRVSGFGFASPRGHQVEKALRGWGAHCELMFVVEECTHSLGLGLRSKLTVGSALSGLGAHLRFRVWR